ncbi:MAG: hypothetical protein ACYC91_14805 [Solirubrobacteraceae bacterium]
MSEWRQGTYIAGFLTGLSGAFGVMLREYAPSYIENVGLGMRGEQRTRRMLKRLGWPYWESIDWLRRR